YLHRLNTVVNLGILGKISSYPTYPIAVILKMAMHLEDPELTAFARGGKGRNEIGMKAQLVQDQLFASPPGRPDP
ncbi:MAG: hypothetical protein ABSE84_19425, partial [Isosphaeraceae bacterium]